LVAPTLKLWAQTYKQIKDSKFPNIKHSEIMTENPV